MKGFETVCWEENLPGGGPAHRSYEDAMRAWSACWTGPAIGQMIANLSDCEILPAPTLLTPMTRTRAGALRQAWICSPWSAFGPYGFDEARKLRSAMPRFVSRVIAALASIALQPLAPDRNIQVRSQLFTTPIHPDLQDKHDLAQRMQSLADEHGVPVLCRGFSLGWQGEEIAEAMAQGLIAVPSRVVWLFDGSEPVFLERHNTRMDLALARKNGVRRLMDPDEVEPWVWDRFAELYAKLYLEKHNRLNPVYTAAYMKAAAKSDLVEFLVFPKGDGDDFDAFVGLFSAAGQSTCPLVGVDTQRQKERGLYRMCCALCFGLAAARGDRLNFSSGAGRFKKLRGGRQSLEYALLAIPKALVVKRRTWSLLSAMLERWVTPLLLKDEL